MPKVAKFDGSCRHLALLYNKAALGYLDHSLLRCCMKNTCTMSNCDDVGVMLLLHQKMRRDAEVATAYLMMDREEEEEPCPKKRKHTWWFRPMLHPQPSSPFCQHPPILASKMYQT